MVGCGADRPEQPSTSECVSHLLRLNDLLVPSRRADIARGQTAWGAAKPHIFYPVPPAVFWFRT